MSSSSTKRPSRTASASVARTCSSRARGSTVAIGLDAQCPDHRRSLDFPQETVLMPKCVQCFRAWALLQGELHDDRFSGAAIRRTKDACARSDVKYLSENQVHVWAPKGARARRATRESSAAVRRMTLCSLSGGRKASFERRIVGTDSVRRTSWGWDLFELLMEMP